MVFSAYIAEPPGIQAAFNKIFTEYSDICKFLMFLFSDNLSQIPRNFRSFRPMDGASFGKRCGLPMTSTPGMNLRISGQPAAVCTRQPAGAGRPKRGQSSGTGRLAVVNIAKKFTELGAQRGNTSGPEYHGLLRGRSG
jgi:hypothetical protein